MKYIIKIKDFKLSEKLNKSYETVNYKPNLNDYAIIKVFRYTKTVLEIGQITDIKFESAYPYYIEINEPFFADTFQLAEIECWSDNKEDLETILTANKYNL